MLSISSQKKPSKTAIMSFERSVGASPTVESPCRNPLHASRGHHISTLFSQFVPQHHISHYTGCSGNDRSMWCHYRAGACRAEVRVDGWVNNTLDLNTEWHCLFHVVLVFLKAWPQSSPHLSNVFITMTTDKALIVCVNRLVVADSETWAFKRSHRCQHEGREL